jgi:transposase
MHGPYPGELRMRVIDFVEEGGSRREAAEQFEVSVSSAIRWVQRFREDGTCESMPRGGSTSPLEKHLRQILALISAQPDLTLDEIVSALHKRRIWGSRSALSRFFARHGITVKKSLQAAERKRADVARARRRWIREQGFLDPAHLVFIDETAVTTNMVRLNGWNPRGERLVSDAPTGHWETVTFIAGLRQTGVVAPMLIKGAMNGEAFLAYIEQCLVPTLKPRDDVVVDNVPFHKVAGVEEAIQAVGASLRYLPKYSPDLNPIELLFHPLKTFLRKAAQRTIEGLHRCVGSYIRTLNPRECMGYFRHSGYEPL